jgi:hypothetical protein
VIRQHLHLVVGKRHGDERVGLARVAALPTLGAGTRGARGAVMAVGDVEGRNPGEQLDELAALFRVAAQMV